MQTEYLQMKMQNEELQMERLSRRLPLAFSLIVVATIAADVSFANASTPSSNPVCRVQFRLVDETIAGSAGEAPPRPGDELFPQADQMPIRLAPSDKDAAPVKLGPIWLKPEVLITGEMIAEAHPDLDLNGGPSVRFQFTEEGGRRFAAITTAHVGSRFAIISDGVVVTAPVIVEPITGRRGEITGLFSAESAHRLSQSILQCRPQP